jgi:hypothetical protein
MKSDVANIAIWRNGSSTNLTLTIFTQGFVFLSRGQRKGASKMCEDINFIQKAKGKGKKKL